MFYRDIAFTSSRIYKLQFEISLLQALGFVSLQVVIIEISLLQALVLQVYKLRNCFLRGNKLALNYEFRLNWKVNIGVIFTLRLLVTQNKTIIQNDSLFFLNLKFWNLKLEIKIWSLNLKFGNLAFIQAIWQPWSWLRHHVWRFNFRVRFT